LIQVAAVKNKTLLVLLTAMLPSISFGQDSQNYQCTQGDLTRRVEIVNEGGSPVPCEVHYYKDSIAQGEQQVLWRATNDADYCESKAREFIAKLEGWGWSCGPASAPAAAPEPATDLAEDEELAPVDDTDALMPGDETATTENR
jgi:hypothetical protein